MSTQSLSIIVNQCQPNSCQSLSINVNPIVVNHCQSLSLSTWLRCSVTGTLRGRWHICWGRRGKDVNDADDDDDNDDDEDD